MTESPTCPYCDKPSEFFASSAPFYHGRDYGPVWACVGCDAWVGCHPGGKPLGRLADKRLRQARVAAHAAFDPLVEAKRRRGISKNSARAAGYKWLAQRMGLARKDCHIGMFDEAQCRRVVDVCSPYLPGRPKVGAILPAATRPPGARSDICDCMFGVPPWEICARCPMRVAA